jgi:putative acetyltransferase
MQIVEDAARFLPDLIRLNEAWISEHFGLEESDHALARDPTIILRDGGHTFSMVHAGRVVGVVALFRTDDGQFELARMAVEPTFQGKGVGRALAKAALARARALGATELRLLSNTKLARAVALYRSLGFEEVTSEHALYRRCNIVMCKHLGAFTVPFADGVTLTDDRGCVDFDLVHRWLTATYWSPGISRSEVWECAAGSSLVIGAYAPGGGQVAYARVASDRARFAYIMDVFVAEEFRGRGLGKALVRFALDHPDHRAVYKWLLGTRDAHGVYATVGFAALAHPEVWMMLDKGWPQLPGPA